MPRKPSPLTVAKNKVRAEHATNTHLHSRLTNTCAERDTLSAELESIRRKEMAAPFRSLQIVVTDEKGKQLSVALYSVNKGDHLNFVVDSDGDTSVQSSFAQ